jgi:hypothetical protein
VKTFSRFPGGLPARPYSRRSWRQRQRRAAGLAAHLGLLTILEPVLEPDGNAVVVEVEIKDEYKPPLPLAQSLSVLQGLVANSFPTAVVTKDETKSNERKFEWEVPGSPKIEIKFEWKSGDKTKIEFKKLPAESEAAALAILAGVQAEFLPAVAVRERKEKVEAKETVFKEVKIELKYPLALPAAALPLMAQQVSLRLPTVVLKKQEANKIEWEVPAQVPGGSKGEIKAEIKTDDGKTESKFELKKLPSVLHEPAIEVLAAVQEAYPQFLSEFAKYEFKFEAKDA